MQILVEEAIFGAGPVPEMQPKSSCNGRNGGECVCVRVQILAGQELKNALALLLVSIRYFLMRRGGRIGKWFWRGEGVHIGQLRFTLKLCVHETMSARLNRTGCHTIQATTVA
jgi:hypothetical protein